MSSDVLHPLPSPVQVSGFAPDDARSLAEMAEHCNDDHEDTVCLIASGGVGRQAALSAEIVAIDPGGLQMTVRPVGSTDQRDPASHVIHLPFEEDRRDVDGVRDEVFALITRARAAVEDSIPVTSLEAELAGRGELPTMVTSVAHIRDLTPTMREITVRGGLEGFTPLGPDQFVYVITAMPGGAPVRAGFTMAQLQETPRDAQPPAAYYTVRRWRPDVDELDLWFVLHGRSGGVAGWAAAAEPGDPVALWGPRTSYRPPPDTTSLLLVGDESALPAIAAILEDVGPGGRARVIVEVASHEHVVDLPGGPEIDVEWLARGTAAPGTGTRLLDAVASIDLDPRGLYAFGAAETRQIAAVRHQLRVVRGLTPAQVRMTGYWRRR